MTTEVLDMAKHEQEVDAFLASMKTFLLSTRKTPDQFDKLRIGRQELGQAYDLVYQMGRLMWGTDYRENGSLGVRLWDTSQSELICDVVLDFPKEDANTARLVESQNRLYALNSALQALSSRATQESMRSLYFVADIQKKELAIKGWLVRYPGGRVSIHENMSSAQHFADKFGDGETTKISERSFAPNTKPLDPPMTKKEFQKTFSEICQKMQEPIDSANINLTW